MVESFGVGIELFLEFQEFAFDIANSLGSRREVVTQIETFLDSSAETLELRTGVEDQR